MFFFCFQEVFRFAKGLELPHSQTQPVGSDPWSSQSQATQSQATHPVTQRINQPAPFLGCRELAATKIRGHPKIKIETQK